MASAISSPFTTGVVTSFDIHQPEKFNKLFRQYGKQHLSYFAFLKTLGFISPVQRNVYSNFVEDWIHASFSSRTNASSTGPGTSIAITLSVSDVDTANGNKFYPQEGDQIMTKVGIQGVIKTIDTTVPTAPVLTCFPDTITDDFGTVSAQETVIIYTSRSKEGSSAPQGRVSKALEEQFNTKIIRESVDCTGTEITQLSWVDQMSDGSSSGKTWFALKGQYDAQYRMQLKIGGALLFDKLLNNPNAQISADGTDSNTTGLYSWIKGGGNSSTYTPGSFQLSDFDYMTRVMDKYDAPMDFAFFAGINLYQDVENSLSNLFTQNPILYVNGVAKTYSQAIYGQNPAEADGRTVDIGFRCLHKTNRNYHMVRLGELSNPQTFNAPGFTKNALGFVCPLDTKEVKTPDGGSKVIPRIGMRYLVSPDGKYNRQMISTMEGMLAPTATNGDDKLKVNMLTEFGSQYFGKYHFFLWESA